MSEELSKEPLSNVSDSSFVILGPGSFAPLSDNESWNDAELLTDKPNSVVDMKNSQNQDISFKTFTITNDEGDAQDKLNHLLQENQKLKETLNQNNLAIKSQLNTFFMWQQEVLKTHETHKQKFLETKDLILKLRLENANLKKQIENMTTTTTNDFSLLSNGDSNIKSNFSPGVDSINKPDLNIDEVHNLQKNILELERLQENAESNDECLSLDKYDLQKTIKKLKHEILNVSQKLKDFQCENDYLKNKMKEQNTKSQNGSSFVPVSLPNSEARVQISNLLKQLDDERRKVTILKKEIKKMKVLFLSKNDNPSDELSICVDELNDMNDSVQNQNMRFDGLNSWINLAEETVMGSNFQKEHQTQILSEISHLKNYVMREEKISKEKEESLKVMHYQFSKLLNDYKELQEKLNVLNESKMENDKMKGDINSLVIELNEKDEKLKSKEDECEKLKESIANLNLECEKIPVLKVQAELYESDFKDEREAREKLVGEKEKMAEQIRILQTKLENLNSEKKEGNSNDQSSSAKGSSDTSTVSPLQRNKSRFVCPKCMFSFSNLNTCEKHIDECLNIHFYP
ncbi:Optineurin, putative [Pediculus humanus corporis]|uniref:Optineurin, putative n=1 Tax=Pediculus humanus subsp. corporis TaxID=121224 RepID=E0VHH6_PEDHC|nr:Optineurin, putative [Pediculus humanus corporis]EEB12832.1 Optineurin, putative [Pediculus humanus corporis]